ENTNYPFYKSSKDKGFIEACEALLADKLITLQWWEEDRGQDGFYTIDPGEVAGADYFSASVVTSRGAGKAFCFYHRPDGVVVGFWKNQYSALSPDDGKTWTRIAQNKTLWTCGAKTWAQRTEDGRYAIVHNQSVTRRNRFPMIAITSQDGRMFDDMLCLNGEVPLRRYRGIHKNIGTQYFRGIIEGNGDPPGNDMWIVYSMNKEDMWISRVTVPITGEVKTPVADDFDTAETEMDLKQWNLYTPKWAPIRVLHDGEGNNRWLELRDEEPYDYAMAERIFPQAAVVEIEFRVNAKEAPQGYMLQIEVQDRNGKRPMCLSIDNEWLAADHRTISATAVAIKMERWYTVRLSMDCTAQNYDVYLDGRPAIEDVPFAEKVTSLEKIVYRTGPYRGMVSPEIVDEAVPRSTGLDSEDLPGADEKAPLCRYWIDDVRTK
ncbi:hypothetical protein JXO59_15290, partial [candidate division KSB1 bacterium]|nr:hypothetical protein [candidate division KSB1 bacterium]